MSIVIRRAIRVPSIGVVTVPQRPKAGSPPSVPEHTREIGDVEAAVARDIAEIAKRDEGLASSGLAAAALALARELDIPKNSATSKSMCARALAEQLDRLRALAPPATEADDIDDLATRRQKRLAG